MILKAHRWGPVERDCLVCLHGIAHHGRVFEGLGRHFSELGHSVVALDLRGHGESGREPPWSLDAHVEDVLETVDALDLEAVTWIGHSFGGRLAAALADRSLEKTSGVVLLDPGFEIDPEKVLRSAETERLDWSFATVDGAANAFLANESMVAPNREEVLTFVEQDVRKGPDGRFRFSYSPAAGAVAWSEVAAPGLPIAELPTLLVTAERSFVDGDVQRRRYGEALGDLLTAVTVPKGHNVFWESPAETFAAIEQFLE